MRLAGGEGPEAALAYVLHVGATFRVQHRDPAVTASQVNPSCIGRPQERSNQSNTDEVISSWTIRLAGTMFAPRKSGSDEKFPHPNLRRIVVGGNEFRRASARAVRHCCPGYRRQLQPRPVASENLDSGIAVV